MAMMIKENIDACEMCENTESLLYKVNDLFVCKNCRLELQAPKFRKKDKGRLEDAERD